MSWKLKNNFVLSSMKKKDEMDIGRVFDHIPKYLTYKNECYSPIILKWEWDGHSNAYWAFYGKEVVYGYSNRKLLFAVCASSFDQVVRKFLTLCLDYESEGWIVDKEWRGPKPHTFNFCNDKCDHSLLE